MANKQPRNYRECDNFKGYRKQYLKNKNVKCTGKLEPTGLMIKDSACGYCQNCPIYDMPNQFLGEIGEIHIYNKNLSPEEITKLEEKITKLEAVYPSLIERIIKRIKKILKRIRGFFHGK